MPFGMISKRQGQLLADGGDGRLIHEPTLGRTPQGVNWRFGGNEKFKMQNANWGRRTEAGEQFTQPTQAASCRRACTMISAGYTTAMSIEQLKREVASLGDREQAELISYTLQLRHAHDPDYRREVTERLNDADKAHG